MLLCVSATSSSGRGKRIVIFSDCLAGNLYGSNWSLHDSEQTFIAGMLPSARMSLYGLFILHLSHMKTLKLLLPIVFKKRGISYPYLVYMLILGEIMMGDLSRFSF